MEPERGQASVELLGVLPAVLLVALAAWQLALAGLKLAGAQRGAGGSAGRGRGRTARRRRAAPCPAHLRRGLRVSSRDGVVTVRVRLPIVMRDWGSPLRIRGSAGLPTMSASRGQASVEVVGAVVALISAAWPCSSCWPPAARRPLRAALPKPRRSRWSMGAIPMPQHAPPHPGGRANACTCMCGAGG